MKILFALNRSEANKQAQRNKHDQEFYIKYVINNQST